jgi:hypothetical protein
MPNMSYCRFYNTLEDLRDCYDHIDDDLSDSEEEARARKALVKLCAEITNVCGEEEE